MALMQVACAADSKFIPHCAAMLRSLLSTQNVDRLKVYFLHDVTVSKASINALQEMVCSEGAGWESLLVSEEQRARCPGSARFGKVAWYRVLLPELLQNAERVLYLDADTIIRRDLSPLWDTDLRDYPVGAVANPLYPFMSRAFLDELQISSDNYFNSGVLLFDLEMWRRENLSDEVLTRAANQTGQEWPDQNALNVVLRRRWKTLSPEWNAQNTIFDLPDENLPFPREEVELARRDPAIIHFIGPYKPWHYRCKHAWRDLYWFHLEGTPWNQPKMTGVTFSNRLLRLLPEQWGWHVDTLIRNFRRKNDPATKGR